MMHDLLTKLGASSASDIIWLTVGLLGQLMFTGRFIVQWIASERAGRSVMPVAFWYFSIIGGLIVLAYGIHKLDLVIILGQLPGVVVYSRNLWLIHKGRKTGLTRLGLTEQGQTAGWFRPALLIVTAITLLRWVLLAFDRTDLIRRRVAILAVGAGICLRLLLKTAADRLADWRGDNPRRQRQHLLGADAGGFAAWGHSADPWRLGRRGFMGRARRS